MASLSRPSTSQTESRIKRKPPPFLDLSLAERYPPPDPHDPFAPLWVLRSRTSSAHLIQPQSIYNLSLDKRRQSAFSLQYPSPNWSNDDVRGVMSDSEHSYGRHSLRQSRTRQRAHSMALLTTAGSSAFEFPSVYPGIGNGPLAGPNERSHSSADVERPDRARALHTASTAQAQKRITQFLKPKKLGTFVHPTSHPRVHKGSISGPVLASKPPVMNTFSLTVQTSVADSQRTTITSPIGLGPSRHRRPSTAPSARVASRSQTTPIPVTGSISQNIDKTLMRLEPTSSVSHSAFIHISYPTPSDQYSQPLFDNAYTSPRPAPRPPQSSTTRLPLTVPGKLSKHRAPKASKSKPLPKAPPVVQPEWALPSQEQLARAASLLVIAESGVRVTFGSLFAEQRTIVIFIRHFWCPLCQDYMSSVRSFVRPDVLRSLDTLGMEGGTGAKLVIVSNGSHAMISKYKQIFHMPFEMYTDPTLAVYNTLGMTRGRDGDHPACASMSKVSLQEPAGTDKRKKDSKIWNGGYVKHGTMGGIVMVLVRALKVGMPLWEKGGDVAQLGGEFVFGPGLTCSYAHRMQSPRGHAPIQDVVKAASEVAARTSAAAEKRKPLPVVDIHDKSALPVKCTEKGDSGSYDIVVSDENHIEAQDTHKKQDAYITKAEEQEKMVVPLPQEERGPEGDNGVVRLEHEAENSDVESVAATCSDLGRSDGSTMQQSTESEEYTLNGSVEEASGQDDAKPPEQVGNAQLELKNY